MSEFRERVAAARERNFPDVQISVARPLACVTNNRAVTVDRASSTPSKLGVYVQ